MATKAKTEPAEPAETVEQQTERLRVVGDTTPAPLVVMNAEVAAKLREPFKDAQIGKLPRVTCSDCRKSSNKVCAKHEKRRCRECGGWLTDQHIHLDYVGHAAATDRLLAVDPYWTWEPFALDAIGLPAFDAYNGLWIHLTIAGVTRPGYGDATNSGGIKEVIGDAIRNGAMRFGVALDLWSKEDLAAAATDGDGGSERPSEPAAAGGKGEAQGDGAGGGSGAQAAPTGDDRLLTDAQRKRLGEAAAKAEVAPAKVREIIAVVTGGTAFGSKEVTRRQLNGIVQAITDYAADTEKGDAVISGFLEANQEAAGKLLELEAGDE